ncbi:MAG TPA: hypothetical protein PLT25_02090 [Acidocella sp.]|nr:hypothetical protein [Acidocella sp.]
MDYYQGVVTEYLVKNKSVFINPEYELALNPNQKIHPKGTSWVIDILAVDFVQEAVFLCEVTYSRTQHALVHKMADWADRWSEISTAVRHQTHVPEYWRILPRVFVPKEFRDTFAAKVHQAWPELEIIALEDVAPWVKSSSLGNA